MKLVPLLSIAAAFAAATFALGLVIGAFVVPAYTLIAAASFALIIASDYAPQVRSYRAGAERLPLAI